MPQLPRIDAVLVQIDPAEVSNSDRLKICSDCGGEGCDTCFGGGVKYP